MADSQSASAAPGLVFRAHRGIVSLQSSNGSIALQNWKASCLGPIVFLFTSAAMPEILRGNQDMFCLRIRLAWHICFSLPHAPIQCP